MTPHAQRPPFMAWPLANSFCHDSFLAGFEVDWPIISRPCPAGFLGPHPSPSHYPSPHPPLWSDIAVYGSSAKPRHWRPEPVKEQEPMPIFRFHASISLNSWRAPVPFPVFCAARPLRPTPLRPEDRRTRQVCCQHRCRPEALRLIPTPKTRCRLQGSQANGPNG